MKRIHLQTAANGPYKAGPSPIVNLTSFSLTIFVPHQTICKHQVYLLFHQNIAATFTNMKFSASLALVAGLTSVSASPLTIKGTEYPDGTTVTEYPNGLPADLVPRAMGVEAEQGGLVKRDNAGVYLCDDINFSGYCVHIVAPLYKCGMSHRPDLQ